MHAVQVGPATLCRCTRSPNSEASAKYSASATIIQCAAMPLAGITCQVSTSAVAIYCPMSSQGRWTPGLQSRLLNGTNHQRPAHPAAGHYYNTSGGVAYFSAAFLNTGLHMEDCKFVRCREKIKHAYSQDQIKGYQY